MLALERERSFFFFQDRLAWNGWTVWFCLMNDYFWSFVRSDATRRHKVPCDKKTFRWVLIPSICSQPIMGKGLLRLPPFYAKCLLISARDLWTSLPRAFIDVGVPPNTPSVWYWSKLISWLLLRTVCCFADLFDPSRNDQRVLICLRHWGWSRPCSAHHQWVSGIRFALAQTHPFLSEGEPRISTVLRQTIESFSGPC